MERDKIKSKKKFLKNQLKRRKKKINLKNLLNLITPQIKLTIASKKKSPS